METDAPSGPETPEESPATAERVSLSERLFGRIRRRIVAGLIVALPIAITFFILFWLYGMLDAVIFQPISWAMRRLFLDSLEAEGLPSWWEQGIEPILNIATVLAILYVLGLFARSRIRQTVDWVLLRVPIFTTVYKGVRGAFQALEMQEQAARKFERVVLIEFPHPGAKVPAFVTKAIKDKATGKTILCLYVPTTPIPTSGYMLMIPEEKVIEPGWGINETLQAVISGGLTAPDSVRYELEPPQTG